MNIPNDQWFEPGDKVMKVSNCNLGKNIHPQGSTQMGKVYCIEACWRGLHCNAVNFIGFDQIFGVRGLRLGWPAQDYRKVEEIKLCVKAANFVTKPQELTPV